MSSLVKKLVHYGKVHLGLNDLDAIYVENVLYRKLKLVPTKEEVDLTYINDLKVPDVLLDELRAYIRETNLGSEENFELFIVKYGFTDEQYKKIEELIKANFTDIPTEIVVKNKISKGDGTRGTRKSDAEKIKELVEQGKTVDEAINMIKEAKIKSAKANWEKKDVNKFNDIVNKIVEQANNKFGYTEQ